MEIPSQNQNPDDDELLTFLEGCCGIASCTSTCQEIDPSGALPAECKTGSAQWWAGVFGTFVALYALHDKEWRESLFNEGEFIIDGKPTKIWVWDDIWGDVDAKGTPDRLIPLVVGSLLSDYDDSRDWEALREHYLCMWNGSYKSYGKPLSEVGPQDDLYWAMRIGFVDTILQHPKSAEEQVDLRKGFADIKAAIRDSETNLSLRLLKAHREADEKWHELSTRLPHTPESIRLQLKQRLGDNIRLLSEPVLNYCVDGELFYESGTKHGQAVLSFTNAVEECLNCYLYYPLVDYLRRKGEKGVISFRRKQEIKKLDILRYKPSLSDWADILDLLATPTGKSLSDLGILPLRQFLAEHLGTQHPLDFRPISESLREIQQCRNRGGGPHPPSTWENPQQDLERTRSLVLGIRGFKPVIVHIAQLLAPQK